MSLDFRLGLIPAGVADPPSEYGLGVLPFTPVIDYTSTAAPTAPNYPLTVPGDASGDMRIVPGLVMAFAYAKTWGFSITMNGPGGIAHTWSGSIARGRKKTITDGGTSESGTALTTLSQAWDAGIIPPETEDATFPDQATEWDEAVTTGSPEQFLEFVFDPLTIQYLVIPNVWVIGATIGMGITDGDDNTATAGDSGGSGTVSGLTVCGVPWPLGGTDVSSLAGDISPTEWLE